MVKTIDATTTDRLRRSPLDIDWSPSCARKRACMELTTIRRFQRLYKSLLLYQMDDVQRATSILGGREVSRPNQDGLSINEFCGLC